MKKIEAIIFDMDGTLYSFDKKNESHFSSSNFGKQIHANCVDFFKDEFKLSAENAMSLYQDFRTRHNDEVSLGLEKERGIDRSKYFEATWNLNPSEFMEKNNELVLVLSSLTIKTGILSAAPKVWVDSVLKFLEISHFFDPAIFTGDPNIRKPDPQAFQQLADLWGIDPEKIIAIGDQEATDIIPAKSLGMKTVRIGKNTETEADFIASNAIQAIALLKQEGIL